MKQYKFDNATQCSEKLKNNNTSKIKNVYNGTLFMTKAEKKLHLTYNNTVSFQQQKIQELKK